MRRHLLLMSGVLIAANSFAQLKDFSYKFYGQLRTDLYYDSRANEELVDGLFHMYPKDEVYDADGNDLNATPTGSFYTLYSRLGIDVTGPKLGKAKTSAKVEMDFRGSGTGYSTVRLRHAYFDLNWGKSAILAGQTWHPLFGNVSPQILNLSTGAPFQPFSRAPQIRYRYTDKAFQLTAAAIWQLQFASQGIEGKSTSYIKNSCVPEFYVGADYQANGWIAGAGVELLSLKPRTQSKVGSDVYKVNERITTLSYEAHVKYSNEDWFVAAKSVLGSNLTQTCMLGGFGIKSIDPRTGKQEYTPIRVSSTWINAVYGKKWKPGIFAGYIKNLGTSDTLASDKLYGTGTDVDQVMTAGAELSYNVKHWKFGAEYTYTSAAYGSLDKADGRITDTHSVGNHRIVGVAMFTF